MRFGFFDHARPDECRMDELSCDFDQGGHTDLAMVSRSMMPVAREVPLPLRLHPEPHATTAAVRRALVLLTVTAACLAALVGTAAAQSSGDEPSLDERLRAYLMKIPDNTKDPVQPTEAERAQEQSRRRREGPGYVGPLSTETSTGRLGAAGWTSSGSENMGRATAAPHQSGWAGFGFAVEWGGSGSEAP